MAEKAAHLTSTNHQKPSIFDIIAQDSLNSTIYPSLNKIAQFLSAYNPRKFTWLIYYCDEVYLILNGLLQYHYIKKYGASFAEYFYGLKRISNTRQVYYELTKKEEKLSLLLLVIIPYLRIKIEDKLVQYRLELADGVLLNNWKRKLKRMLCYCQSIFHMVSTFWTMTLYLKYMAGLNEYQNITLKVLKLKLIYSNIKEENMGFFDAVFCGKLALSTLNVGLFGQSIENFLEFGAFFVQFLRSWQNDKSYNFTDLPVPDPPQYDHHADNYKGVCPLCMQKWKIPTVVAVSGYIYCFRCIVRHLQESNFCPVTNLPTTVTDIFRLQITCKK